MLSILNVLNASSDQYASALISHADPPLKLAQKVALSALQQLRSSLACLQ